MVKNMLQKHAFLRAIILLIYLSFIILPGIANAEKQDMKFAKDFVQNIGDNVINIVTDIKLNTAAKESKLDEIFQKSVDIDWIAKFVVGRYWRESSDQEKSQYLTSYSKFLVNSYVPKFRQYTGQKLKILDSSEQDKNEYLVETEITDQDGKSYKVDYRLIMLNNNEYKIRDIIAEGVSLIITQRSDFSSILLREGMTSLIDKLKEKNS